MITFLAIIIIAIVAAIFAPALSDLVCDTPRIVEARPGPVPAVALPVPRTRRARTLGDVAAHPDFQDWAFA